MSPAPAARRISGRSAQKWSGQSNLSNRVAAIDRGCVKTKTELAVKEFCKIQTSKSRRFESRLGFLARFAQFAKVPRVLTQPRPGGAGGEWLLCGTQKIAQRCLYSRSRWDGAENNGGRPERRRHISRVHDREWQSSQGQSRCAGRLEQALHDGDAIVECDVERVATDRHAARLGQHARQRSRREARLTRDAHHGGHQAGRSDFADGAV
jgi:hypothetical protein